jgi:hypothetical protein
MIFWGEQHGVFLIELREDAIRPDGSASCTQGFLVDLNSAQGLLQQLKRVLEQDI